MPPKFPDAIKNMPDFREMRAMGIALAAKKVLEKDYEEAKRVFAKVLEISPNDAEVLCLVANVYIIEGNFKKAFETILSMTTPMIIFSSGFHRDWGCRQSSMPLLVRFC